MSIMTKAAASDKFSELDNSITKLKSYVDESARTGTAVHQVEKNIFKQILEIGGQALQYFFNIQGNGELGETLTITSGKTYKRLNDRTRGYHSIFGRYELTRAVYGSHESKKIEVAPLDIRLQLPSNEHSYLLQEWSQMMAVEVPFKKSMEILSELFPITMTVDTLEQTNRAFGEHIISFREKLDRDIPKQLDKLGTAERKALQDSLLVLSADGKGVPIKHPSDSARIESNIQWRYFNFFAFVAPIDSSC